MAFTGKWVVNVLGDHTHGEISILRDDYAHGKESYGWCNNSGMDPKILVASVQHWESPADTWAKIVAVAEEKAREMNLDELLAKEAPDLLESLRAMREK